jgi:hypothetical protein
MPVRFQRVAIVPLQELDELVRRGFVREIHKLLPVHEKRAFGKVQG